MVANLRLIAHFCTPELVKIGARRRTRVCLPLHTVLIAVTGFQKIQCISQKVKHWQRFR